MWIPFSSFNLWVLVLCVLAQRPTVGDWTVLWSCLDTTLLYICGVAFSGVMRAPLRWLLWDVKDTLIRVRASVGEQYCKEAERMGLNLSPMEVEAAFHQAYRHYSSRYPNYGVTQGMDGQSWWMGLVRDTFSRCRVQDPVVLDTVAHNLYYNFCNAENWEVKKHCSFVAYTEWNILFYVTFFWLVWFWLMLTLKDTVAFHVSTFLLYVFVSGISRLTKGPGALLLARTEAWCGVKLWQPPQRNSTCLWTFAALQLFNNIGGSRCSEAKSSHLWSGPAEMQRAGS